MQVRGVDRILSLPPTDRPMAINVVVYGDRYQVTVSPPEGPFWRSSEALTATDVLAKLSSLGCHSTNITDALSAADPNWAVRHDEELQRGRHGPLHEGMDVKREDMTGSAFGKRTLPRAPGGSVPIRASH
jgi:hypothetical protein